MEIKDIKQNLFREYDIRGVYEVDIDINTAYTIGKSYGSYLQEKYNLNKCLVGQDNRLSSPLLNFALVNGILDSGCSVIDLNLVTTPMLYYARYIMRLPGIMITASHNPGNENGFKFSVDHLSNAAGLIIHDFKDYTNKKQFKSGKGTMEVREIAYDFIQECQRTTNIGKRKLKIVIDPANGTTSPFVRMLHDKFNFDITYIYADSDGSFPNHHPDPNEPQNMIALRNKVLEIGADLGISYDGDGDRVGLIDEKGNWISPDYIMIIIIKYLIDKVSNKTFSFDVKCSKALEDEIIKIGGNPLIYQTGASFAQSKVIFDRLLFGGEYSGHLYFNDRMYPHSCGMYAGLRILEILSNCYKPFSKLLDGVTIYENKPETRIDCPDDKKFEVVERIKQYCISKNYSFLDIDGVRVTFPDGWALVRASNTGPKLTTRYEATTKERLEAIEQEFNSLININ